MTMFLEVILDDQAPLLSLDSYLIICLRLDSHQAGSFLLSLSPEPSHKRIWSTIQRKPPLIELVPLFRAHTEQHQVNSLRISLLKTWILNLIPTGNLTTITHEIFVRFVPDYIINKTVFILLPPPECSLYVGHSYYEYDTCRFKPNLHASWFGMDVRKKPFLFYHHKR
ncbi:hypothetical protein CHARACLAT_022412 [Characodon lateralis]|uniref:Uncharacterized protein n=1 Tax=Characodon lateralis TaxID=208331 RepID=A0ABU7F8A0_9TELE|nr:hypothetical protein [Characodon lateralis]